MPKWSHAAGGHNYSLLKYGNNTYRVIHLLRVYGFLSILAATLTVFFLLVYHSASNSSATRPISPEALQGKAVFQKKACIECHTVFGNGGYRGGDLTKIYGKRGGQALKEHLSQPPVFTGARQKRHARLNESEATAVVAYLEFLNTMNTLDWPPVSKRDLSEAQNLFTN